MTGYLVNAYDRAGEYRSVECPNFASAKEVYVGLRRAYPGTVVLVFNLDRCDYNTDGLTEDESDALDDATIEDAPQAPMSVHDPAEDLEVIP